ncbi:unnamed protein product [Anisakis simplex]|uniref:Calcium uniporter protein n=1 Tax=Anisakis simplex TaxID=6269 RepID=A0A0M3J0K0_ANISI|nr:unnamed protein product [Anisakis simplex]
MLGRNWHWSKQVFACFLPAYPLAHLLYNAYREESPISWIYIKRLEYPVPDHLADLVESEIENVDGLPKADVAICTSNERLAFQLKVSLTDKMDAHAYGGFYLRPAVELQLPLRAAVKDLEEATRLGAIIEISTGISSSRRKTNINSKFGEKLLTEFIISDKAKRFIIQRELQRANSGKAFCMPIFIWMTTVGMSFVFLNIATQIVGPVVAFCLSTVIVFTAFQTFYHHFSVVLEQKLDIETCKKSDVYVQGGLDFLRSTMRLNRYLRSTIDRDEASKCIAENGDRIADKLPYSKRLRKIEDFIRERNFVLKSDLDVDD